ncbi:uracil-DNA glycosylase [Caldicellulosiruptoraceae bacterium PP1]
MKTWEDLINSCNSCTKCSIHSSRTNVVIGDGNINAKLMFIGEAPGEDEDKMGKPFVGKAGKLLELALDSLELNRERDFYICNIIKCRPPNNRVPTENEAQNCLPFLRAQVSLIKPKIIVCLGATAMKYILGKDLKITQDRGRWFKKGDFDIIATYHPAALLRDPNKKEDFYKDLKSVVNLYKQIKED